MNSPWSRGAGRAAALVFLCALATGACGKKPKHAAPPAAAAVAPPSSADVAEREATALGRDVFDLVDRLAAYAASNQRKYPASLRLAGIDSLTPKIARQIDTRANPPMGLAMYRNPLGHQITSCRGSIDLLEESALNDGRFTVTCTDSQGQSAPYKVQKASGR